MRAAARLILVLPHHRTDVISTRLHWLRLFYPSWCNWRTVKSTISGYRPVVCSAHQDCDNRLAGIRSYLSDCLEQSLSGSCDSNLSLSCFRKKLKTYLFKLSSALWYFSTTNCDCALLAAFETFYEKHYFDNNNDNNYYYITGRLIINSFTGEVLISNFRPGR